MTREPTLTSISFTDENKELHRFQEFEDAIFGRLRRIADKRLIDGCEGHDANLSTVMKRLSRKGLEA